MAGVLVLPMLPALFLLWLIYRQDRVEHEPVSMIVCIVMLGALSALPAVALELLAQKILDNLGSMPVFAYDLLENFLGVALIEESVKYFVIRKIAWKHPAFDYRFDGVVYGVASSLGFAALENIFYCMGNMSNLFLRAFTAIPMHCIMGIYMGHYFGLAKQWTNRGDSAKAQWYMFMSMFAPVFIHGLYDFVCTQGAYGESLLWILVFYLFVITIDVIAIMNVKKYAQNDQPI